MKKIIKFLRGRYDVYKTKNIKSAEDLVASANTLYLGAMLSGMEGGIKVIVYAALILTFLLTITSLAGIAMTPVGWTVIGALIAAAVLTASVYYFNQFLKNIADLRKKFAKSQELTTQKASLEKEIAGYRLRLKIEDDVQVPAEFSDQRVRSSFLLLFPILNKFLNKLVEYIRIPQGVKACVDGLLIVSKAVLGIDAQSSHAANTFRIVFAITGLTLSGPVGLGVLLGIITVGTILLAIKKALFDDPIYDLTKKIESENLEEQVKNLTHRRDEYRTLLARIDATPANVSETSSMTRPVLLLRSIETQTDKDDVADAHSSSLIAEGNSAFR
ncbi:MAG: hypothetical protein KBD64_06670 [Gammaproteobacteria bacterium]|nr:hypothetical protein [Gammaproteobacteria bacterium]